MEANESLLDVGEYRVNCARLGRGDPLLLLHGSDHHESWRTWEPMLSLSDSFSLIIPDLVGYGRSTRPAETPDYRTQAHVVRDLLEKIGVGSAFAMGAGWGAQVALELALQWPQTVRGLVLVAASYDKGQLPRLSKLGKPALIVYAVDDMVTQLKAGYLLRDAIGTSRLEVLEPVAKDPSLDFTISHRLQAFRPGPLSQLVRRFLADPSSMVAEPPEMEKELRGMALKRDEPLP
ncbi:MAG TPA: alpha/beta hydrolase [Nitrososphaerales archaeon]|nr:alpha/beta hydrolase [Nitrososphaerales archaeon]